ncbi:Mov34/MPN/PAD-1 family protein [Leptolyngbya sp. FACHB-17]|uniref:Mov34/MPN/PAD-1 family protein n=1 Tax=unclassified Leptolyngbya TaxID=2650499 RepID=UPI0016809C6D|nr:M67 family metallopeptidase [Leptolyngbya sp. FACHB-17]
MILRLNSQHLVSIRAHAERTYPDECCGLLLGKSDPTGKTVMEVKATENRWSDDESGLTRKRQYEIAPEEMLAAMKEARSQGLDIIGIYHSHPDQPAVPSECDRAAAWSAYSYAIVSVSEGKSVDLRCWSLDDQQVFQPEELLIT